jgi:hypothetical protein
MENPRGIINYDVNGNSNGVALLSDSIITRPQSQFALSRLPLVSNDEFERRRMSELAKVEAVKRSKVAHQVQTPAEQLFSMERRG